MQCRLQSIAWLSQKLCNKNQINTSFLIEGSTFGKIVLKC